MSTYTVDGPLFAAMVRGGARNLGANRKIVNDLNVFPVPDGDTGDNMFMTIDSGTSAGSDFGSLDQAASGISRGMLLGARGNSGVILSRIFAGISKGVEGSSQVPVTEFGSAMRSGVEESYQAVSKPVEGTILTVWREAVSYANERIREDSSLEAYFDDLIREMRASLERTPERLEVLKAAGVVDSGGAGLVYIAEGMRSALLNQMDKENGKETAAGRKPTDFNLFTEDSELIYGYCTEFLLRFQRVKVEKHQPDMQEITDYLNRIGDSVVAFRDGSILKVHVHTKTPGEVLNYFQTYGEFLTLKIENMTLQNSEVTIENRFHESVTMNAGEAAIDNLLDESNLPQNRDNTLDNPLDLSSMKHRKTCGIVAVAAGEGLRRTFSELGCDCVVDGGQSMNPSALDLVKAIRSINAETVLVFPNNSNILLTARQAAELCPDVRVLVIPSRDIGQGYAAISMLDTDFTDADALQEELSEIMEGVVTAAVSPASRDTYVDGVPVKKGDYIGFVGDRIYVDEPDPVQALLALADQIDAGDYDIVLLFCGKDTTPEMDRQAEAALKDSFRRAEVISVKGDQPIYNYLLILE
ncbi:MAG: DAK2 domain-containing protein [Lachnospiraceae bacterium]|nr:DAK2 domain-containing protein [Lachnospiraceae bacterium]